MAPALLDWDIRSGHLAAMADRISYDSLGNDDIDLFRLQDAQEKKVASVE